MKLNGKMMAMVVAIGVLGATGCSKATGDDNDVAPEETAATAPVEESTTPGVENWRRNYYNGRRYYAPHGPPAARNESYGRAPSGNHFWSPGYHRWNGRQHVWYGGRWETRRAGYEYAAPRWERQSSRWEYVPGHWVRR